MWDDGEVTGSLSFPVAPMKAILGSLPSPATDNQWAYEIKWDGYRMIAHLDVGSLRLQSMSGRDVTDHYPEVGSMAANVNASSAIVDGELVVLDDDGVPRFDLMQRRQRPAVLQIFDVLQIDGHDTTRLGYLDRRRLLEQLVEPGDHHLVPSHRVGGGAELFVATGQRGLEGVMAKRIDSLYQPGKRSPEWRKVKHRRNLTVSIGGYTDGDGNRSSSFGSLLVGTPHDGGLTFRGAVGTGFNQQALGRIIATLRDLRADECPFDPPPPPHYARHAHWVEPVLRASIEMSELTNDGLIRHGSFVGFTD